jgi:ADP-heptose:LPS heptosyltransferase
MKITISSPDGLGDFILRIPMITALRGAGHELQLMLRQPAASLASEVFPELERHEISVDPYHQEVRKKRNPFRTEQEAIRKFRPDLYVASPFALTFFDEVWLEWNKGAVPVAGFTTREDFWPSGTIADPRKLSSGFQTRVDVPVALPDLEKNRLLGSAILGRELPAEAPHLQPSHQAALRARQILAAHGLEEGGYWVACVGGRSGLMMKDWGEANWREFLSKVCREDERPVVFLGNTKEWESIERIRTGMSGSVNLASEPPPLAVSLALLAMSRGYIGRDSGVMHMAAALGRSVLAAYGGGHWGRFFPSSGAAVVVSQSMSCRGCNFSCPHERPHCITGISMEMMLEGWRRLPDVDGVEVLEQGPDTLLDAIPASEAHAFAMTNQYAAREVAAKLRSRGFLGRFFGG